jgi:hypothetical protein
MIHFLAFTKRESQIEIWGFELYPEVLEPDFLPIHAVCPTLPLQWFLTPTRLYAYQPLLQIVQIRMFRRKRAL